MSATSATVPTLPSLPAISTKNSSGLGWAVRDTMAMVWRNLTVIRRVPQLLVFSLIQPIIFVFMFRYVFGGAISSGIPGLGYVDYLMPGIFVQTMGFGAISTAVGLAEDKNKGLLERLKSLPMSRSAVLAGRVLADTLRNLIIIVLMLGIAFLVGFHTHTDFFAVLAGVGVLVMFGFSLCWIFAVIGLAVPDGESAQAAAFPLLAPLVFASSAFVSAKTMPGPLRWWAERQPVSMTATAVRSLMLGHGIPRDYVWGSLAWTVGITLVLAPIAVRRFRKA
jgi:ABC-2 type transport system permease protein/oleandomycin transport system permease protein